jgi:steroid delta-isomerase-like uncharacterized protein
MPAGGHRVGIKPSKEVSHVAQNAETSRRFIEEAFNDGNLDVIDEVTADGFVNHDPLAGDQDAQAGKQQIAAYRAAFPDIHITVEDVIEAGDQVCMRWTGEGTFENEFMGLQPTGQKGDPVRGISIDRFDADGKIAESWSQWDTLTLLRNVGAIPEEAAAAAG